MWQEEETWESFKKTRFIILTGPRQETQQPTWERHQEFKRQKNRKEGRFRSWPSRKFPQESWDWLV
jgi:hypothetical protein